MHKIKTCQFINVLDYRFWAVAALHKIILTYWNHPLKVSTTWWITELLKILDNDIERPESKILCIEIIHRTALFTT